MSADPSAGWDAVAGRFASIRSRAGADAVSAWAARLPPASDVLDVGCGTGDPLADVLRAAGHHLWALDAAPAMIERFAARHPDVPVACEPAELSPFFDRTFDGVLAWGLLFLLPARAQRRLVPRLAAALRPGGRLLLTAPAEACTWSDTLTGRRSRSLGEPAYRDLLTSAGVAVDRAFDDVDGNHYLDVVRAAG